MQVAEVGRGLTGDVSILLLARTASRTWARCCNAKAVRNNESYVDWMLHCRSVEVEVGVWQLGRVESSELVTKTELFFSTTDQMKGRGNRS